MKKLSEQNGGERAVPERFQMSTDTLRQIGRRGSDFLADASPDDMEKYSRWSRSEHTD